MALVTVQVLGHWVLTYQTWVAAGVAPGLKTWKFRKINEIPATTWSIQPPKIMAAMATMAFRNWGSGPPVEVFDHVPSALAPQTRRRRQMKHPWVNNIRIHHMFKQIVSMRENPRQPVIKSFEKHVGRIFCLKDVKKHHMFNNHQTVAEPQLPAGNPKLHQVPRAQLRKRTWSSLSNGCHRPQRADSWRWSRW